MHLSTSDLQPEMQQTDLRDVGRGWERESNAVDVEGNNGHAADAAAAHHGLHEHLDVTNVECKKLNSKSTVVYEQTYISILRC